MYNPQRASPPPSQSSPIPVFNLDDDNLEPLWASASQPSQYTEGFWTKVTEFFHKEMGEQKRSYDSVNCKWKNRIRPKDSAHIGLNLNDEAADSEDINVQEVASMGRDRAKKKASSSGARSETSIAGDRSLVDALLSKFTMAATPCFSQRKEASSEYLRIKERELESEDQKRRELGELERLKIAQRDKELDLQQKMFEFQQQKKWEEDIKYYNEDHEHLTETSLSTALMVKKKIKEPDSEDIIVQEVASMGRDRAKKKASSSGARSKTSIAGDHSLVDALLSKFTMAATPCFSQRKEASFEYLRIKERELESEDQKRRELGELERLKIAQRDKELDLQQKMREKAELALSWRPCGHHYTEPYAFYVL
nr:hypothetical protein [Tanacetum cinerariifolium]